MYDMFQHRKPFILGLILLALLTGSRIPGIGATFQDNWTLLRALDWQRIPAGTPLDDLIANVNVLEKKRSNQLFAYTDQIRAILGRIQNTSSVSIERIPQEPGGMPAEKSDLHTIVSECACAPDRSNSCQGSNGELSLLGIDADVLAIDQEQPINVTIRWQVPVSTTELVEWSQNTWQMRWLHDRLYQQGRVRNLLPNGGFERNLSAKVPLPVAYKDVVSAPNYSQAALMQRHRLSHDVRADQLSQTAVVTNQESGLNGLTTLDPIPAEPRHIFLMAGWLRTAATGAGYLGGVWRDAGRNDVLFQYVVQDQMASGWQCVAGLLEAPENVENFTPLALNDGQGEVSFDNLLLFELPLPNLHQPGGVDQ